MSNVLDVLELEDFERWQLDGVVLAGHRSNFHRVWAGPRLAMTWYSTSLEYTQPPIAGAPSSQTLASFDGRGVYLGGQLGGAVGYKKVFFAFELTVAHFSNSAKLGDLTRPRHPSRRRHPRRPHRQRQCRRLRRS